MVFHHFSQDVFFGAKGCDLAAFNHHECIAFLNGRRAMRDDQHRIAFSFEAPHRSVERRDALIVQIGVGFVQNQKHRIAKKGPRQTDALCLAARQLAHIRIKSLWQLGYHVKGASIAGGCEEPLLRRVCLISGDVFGHRARQ